jgi:hypothetical protein
MHMNIMSHPWYVKRTAKNDSYVLLKRIKSVMFQADGTKYGFINIIDAWANFPNCHQGQSRNAKEEFNYMQGWWSHAIEYHAIVRETGDPLHHVKDLNAVSTS